MIAVVSKENELGRNEYVCNSSDVTETTESSVASADIGGLKGMHGDLMTVIESHVEYLYDATTEKWKRPYTE